MQESEAAPSGPLSQNGTVCVHEPTRCPNFADRGGMRRNRNKILVRATITGTNLAESPRIDSYAPLSATFRLAASVPAPSDTREVRVTIRADHAIGKSSAR